MKHDGLPPKQIAFYGGSFTGLDRSIQQDYLNVARRFIQEGRAHSIRISVRPDQLAPETLSFLYANGVRTVEIGVQSLCDEVLETAGRGHSASEALKALQRAKDCGMEVGAQIMVGLPRDDMGRSRQTVEKIVQTKTDFARIYPVVVLKDTELERMFREGRYRPLTTEEAVSICKELVTVLEEASIRVIRIGLQENRTGNGDTPSWIAGPHHPAFGHLVRAAIYMDRTTEHLQSRSVQNTVASFRMHPNDRPLFQGYRKQNLNCLSKAFNLKGIEIIEDPHLPRGSIQYAAGT
jgi:histone acetyltransferase (RNA polymerase elongator complex component)